MSSVLTGEKLDTVTLQTRKTIDCGGVDAAGNITKMFVDNDVSNQTGVDEYTISRTFDASSSTCKSCPRTEVTTDLFNKVIAARTYFYDDKDRLIHVGASAASGSSSYNPNGTIHFTTDGPVTSVVTYDRYQLRIAHSQVSQASKQLVTDYVYDESTGLPLQVTGPYLSGSSTGQTIGFAYDGFGRVKVVARGAVSGGIAPRALKAFEYRDATTPRSVTAYSFAVPTDVAVAGPLPTGNDVNIATAYRDGVGRVVQVRERLGAADASGAAANVTQPLSGYRVAGAVILDGAGRVRVSLEPYYSSNGSYVDLRSGDGSGELASPGLRGTATAYDPRGRVWCSIYQPVKGSLPTTPAYDVSGSNCVTVPEEDAQARMATATAYRALVVPAGGQTYLAVTRTPPEFGAVTELFDAAGRSWGTIDADGNRTWTQPDPLGRAAGTVREAVNQGEVIASAASTTGYDLLGRVSSVSDPSFGLRSFLYDGDSSRIVTATSQGNDGTTTVLSYQYNDMNRVTSILDQTNPSSSKLVAGYSYDAPYSGDATYKFTAGRVAATYNDNETIAFGYDENGSVLQQDRWVMGLPGRVSRNESKRSDGSPLTTEIDLYDALGSVTSPAPLVYTHSYDSARRLVKLARVGSAATALWELPNISGSSYGAYDAVGHVGQVSVDDGHGVTTRSYSPYTGRLLNEKKMVGTTVLFQMDTVAYRGNQLQEFVEQTTKTHYQTYYGATGSVTQALATPLAQGGTCDSATGGLSQSYNEQFGFNIMYPMEPGPSLGTLQQVLGTHTKCGPAAKDVAYTRTESYLYGLTDGKADRLDRIDVSGTERTSEVKETFGYDSLDHLISVIRDNGDNEDLAYGPDGELVSRKQGQQMTFYVGDDATVTGVLPAGCAKPDSSGCQIAASGLHIDAHVVVGGTRVASVAGATGRALYYYRDRQGSVIATSTGGGVVGAQYRYGPYGRIDKVTGETSDTHSELGYTGALKLSGELLYLKTRVYHAKLRQFLQPDYIDLRRYTYTGGDPVNLVDPLGQEPVSAGMITLTIAQPEIGIPVAAAAAVIVGAIEWGGDILNGIGQVASKVWDFFSGLFGGGHDDRPNFFSVRGGSSYSGAMGTPSGSYQSASVTLSTVDRVTSGLYGWVVYTNEWFYGVGPHVTEFGPDDVQTRALRVSSGYQRDLDWYQRPEQRSGQAYLPHYGVKVNPCSSLMELATNPYAAVVASFHMDMVPDQLDNRVIHVTAHNVGSLTSAGHGWFEMIGGPGAELPSYDPLTIRGWSLAWQPLSNIAQTYRWDEVLP